MDTPQSPRQSPQSPEEEEKDFSDSELLDSPDEEEDRLISDSEIVHEEDNNGLDEEEEEFESRGRGSELEEEREEEDEVVPDFVSDPEDEEPIGESEGMGREDGTIMLVEGDEDCPHGDQLEREEQEDRVIDTPQSPDSEPEQDRRYIAVEDGEEGYSVYRKEISAEPHKALMDEEEEEDKSKVEDEEEDERMKADERRRAIALRVVKDDSASVSRELDEHELDYDEEVPDEPCIPAHEEDEDEEDTKAEGDEEMESEDKSSKKKEKKTILPPSPKDGEYKRTDNSKGQERVHKDSFRDKKKDEDDGEIDEGEIDVSVHSFGSSTVCAVCR